MVCLWNEPRRLGRNKKRKKISGGMVETRSQKVSEDKSTTLEKEIHRSPDQVEDQAGRGIEGNGTRRLTSESTHLEQGHDFPSLTSTIYREVMSELSNISIENPAVGASPTDNSHMHGVPEKAARSSSFSDRFKKTLEN